jgi:hypothetical protein
MLLYMFLFLVAAVLLFQGVNLLGEQRSPTTVIPPEVRLASGTARRVGATLATVGAVLALAALSSYLCPWLARNLVSLRSLGCVTLAVYGLWLVFSRKIDYTPAPAAPAQGHSH